MNYISELAESIRRHVDPALVPKEGASSLFLIYAALALAKGQEVTTEDVHNAWAAWMAGSDPDHEAIVPFSQLSQDVRLEDTPFVTAIRSALRSKTSAL